MTGRRPVADPRDLPAVSRSVRCDGGSDRHGGDDGSPRRESTGKDRDAALAAVETIEEPVVTCEFVEGTPVVEWVNESFAETFDPSRASFEGATLPEVVTGPTDELYPEYDYGAYEGPVTRTTATGPRTFYLRVVPFDAGGARFEFDVSGTE